MTTQAEVEFDGVPESVSLARRFVAATLAAWDLDDMIEVAVLLTSELVTNAVRHARSAVTVAVSAGLPEEIAAPTPPASTLARGRPAGRGMEVLVGVTDGSSAPPAPLMVDHVRESGRGLHLVDALATRWGWRPSPPGKVVWFALAG